MFIFLCYNTIAFYKYDSASVPCGGFLCLPCRQERMATENMKKILSLLLICALALSLSACALTNQGSSASSAAPTESPAPTEEPAKEPSEVPSAAPTEEPSSSASSEGSKVVAAQVKGEGESGSLPSIEGTQEFVEKFDGNEIDAYYLAEIAKASSINEMVDVTNKASQAWETQMNNTYDALMAAVNDDATENEKIGSQQTAWVNDINVTIEEIKAGASDGSMANVEISYGVLLMYRGRCVELLSQLYNETGEVDVKMSSSEAVG